MTHNEARLHALGYAWGVSNVYPSPDKRAGDVLFAEAFAAAHDDYNNDLRQYAPILEDAWSAWQATSGQRIDPYVKP